MNWQELADEINTNIGYHIFDRLVVDVLTFYTRSLISRVVFHENLFSIYLSWTAMFEPELNSWVWSKAPNNDGSPIRIIDGDITNIKKPLLTKGPSGGELIRLPSADFGDPHIYIIPPTYGNKLNVNEIKFINEF